MWENSEMLKEKNIEMFFIIEKGKIDFFPTLMSLPTIIYMAY